MPAPDMLRQLARRLSQSADRVASLTAQRARAVAEVEWDCPRGQRAVRRADALAAGARASAERLHSAARELDRAGRDLDHAP